MKRLAALTLTIWVAAAHAVVATGRAPLTGDTAADRDAALADARKRAVAAEVGVMVNATVLVKNQLLLDDTVLTKAAGYVTNETVAGEREADGFYEVTLSCDVEASLIATDLDGIKRAVVVAVADDTGAAVGHAAREVLVARGYECLDDEFLKAAGWEVAPDRPLVESPEQLPALGRRYLARVIVFGEVAVRDAGVLPDEPLPYGVANPFKGYYVAEAGGYARAVDTDKGVVLAEWQLAPGQVRGFGVTAAIARENCRANLGVALGEFFSAELKNK